MRTDTRSASSPPCWPVRPPGARQNPGAIFLCPRKTLQTSRATPSSTTASNKMHPTTKLGLSTDDNLAPTVVCSQPNDEQLPFHHRKTFPSDDRAPRAFTNGQPGSQRFTEHPHTHPSHHRLHASPFPSLQPHPAQNSSHEISRASLPSLPSI